MIVLLLSTPSNSRIVSSKNELSDVRSHSMDKREISASRWSVIVVLRCVFILVNAWMCKYFCNEYYYYKEMNMITRK